MINRLNKMGYKVEHKRMEGQNSLILYIISPDGTSTPVFYYNNHSIYINASDCSSKEEAEKRVKEGKSIKTTAEELYREYFNLSDDEFTELINGYSMRTHRAFKSFLDKKNFETQIVKEGGIDEIGESEKEYHELADADSLPFELYSACFYKVKSGKYNSKWVVSYGLGHLEECRIVYMIFSLKPTVEDIMSVNIIMETIDLFKSGRLNDNKGLWLDYSDNLIESINYLKKGVSYFE